ncbi:MAG: diguanylate cyclase [Rhodospirillaceae bacterium]|nr:diguanylate cyclase [Rhodospirillaceae bacterium]
MASLTNVVVAGGNAAAAVDRVEMLRPAGFAGLAVSNGLDVQSYVGERQPDLVLIEDGFDDVDAFEVARTLKQNEDTSHIPIIMLCDEVSASALADGFDAKVDDMLASDTPDEIVFARLNPLVRLSTMHSEVRRRLDSARKAGIELDIEGVQDVDASNCRVLFVGTESGPVAALVEALQASEFNPVLEPDHFKAGARIANETFDAAVIAVDDDEPLDKALFLCAHIRNNPRLFNVPVLIAARQNSVDAGEAPYAQGASMVVPLPPDIGELSAGLRFLVRRQRLRWNLHGPLTATLQSGTADSLNGLYSEAFSKSHLAHLLKFGVRRRRNLSLAMFSIQTVTGLDADSEDAICLMQQAADWISDLIRVEDMAGRLGTIEICAILPGAAEREALQATNRITGVLQNNEFKLPDGSPLAAPLFLQSGAVAAAQGESADELIDRVRQSLT